MGGPATVGGNRPRQQNTTANSARAIPLNNGKRKSGPVAPRGWFRAAFVNGPRLGQITYFPNWESFLANKECRSPFVPNGWEERWEFSITTNNPSGTIQYHNHSPSGTIQYHNHINKAASWDHPTAAPLPRGWEERLETPRQGRVFSLVYYYNRATG